MTNCIYGIFMGNILFTVILGDQIKDFSESSTTSFIPVGETDSKFHGVIEPSSTETTNVQAGIEILRTNEVALREDKRLNGLFSKGAHLGADLLTTKGLKDKPKSVEANYDSNEPQTSHLPRQNRPRPTELHLSTQNPPYLTRNYSAEFTQKNKRSRHLRKYPNSDHFYNKNNSSVPVHKRTSVQYSSLVGPSFVGMNGRKTHALAGQTAELDCFIKNRHNYTVSWIRAGDINLLTSAEITYSSDNRFVAVNPGKGQRWVLKIHHLRSSDAGPYICQISTSPPIDTSIDLIVTEATAEVSPSSELFLKIGSNVRLVCRVIGCPYPALPSWYKGGELQKDVYIEESRLIEQSSFLTTLESREDSLLAPNETKSSSEKDINSEILQLWKESVMVPSTDAEQISKEKVYLAKVVLERPQATTALSGVYSCTNTCTSPVNLTLNVLTNDEETAAMQHINCCSDIGSHSLILFLLAYYVFNIYNYFS